MKVCNIKKLLKAAVFVLIFAAVMMVLCQMFIPKTSDSEGGMTNPNARGFYGEPRNSIDLVVMGDSNAYCAYSPMVIWGKYGIPSYVAAEGNQTIVGAINLLDEMLKCQSPKVLVFDVNMLWSGDSNVQRMEDCINSMLGQAVPVVKYHDRWKNLQLMDSFKEKNYTFRSKTRGQRLGRCVKPYTGDDPMKKTDDTDCIPWVTRYFFEELLKKCELNDIQVLLIETPTATSWTYARHVAMEKYAEKNQLKFIDFNMMDGKYKIDWKEDTKDGGMHMNVYGAKKVTAYLGKYIAENYTFDNKKENVEYSDWNVCYKEYKRYVRKGKIYLPNDDQTENGIKDDEHE